MINGNQEITNAYLVWAEPTFQLTFFGFDMPVTWIASFDSIVSAITILLVVAFWRWWATRFTEPDEITKITIGVAISAMGPLALAAAAASVAATGHKANLGWAILNAAGLSFIGLGVRPPTPEWGIMVAEGARFISTGKWWLVAFPGLALMLAVLCFNLLGDGLRDILDPRMRT